MGKSLVVITGASSGMGAAITKKFSEAGYVLGLLARNKKAMEQLQLPNSICIALDVTDGVAFKQAIVEIEGAFGSIDCLINNAGVGKDGDFSSLTDADDEEMVQVNLQGVINGMKSVLPGMQARQSGTIINISSLADRNARPHLATYSATKAAVKSLSESLRMAYAKDGIRICNVAPAKIKTPLLLQSSLTEGQLIEVEDFANTILWIYQQPQNICIRDIVIAPTRYEA